MSRTKDYPIVALKVTFLSTNTQLLPTLQATGSYSLSPIPTNTGTGVVNPYSMNEYEMTYTQANGTNAGIEYDVALVSTGRFRAMSGAYVRRYSYAGPRPLIAARLYGKPQLDVLPATANAGDTISVTTCPDVEATGTTCSCANGGIMVNDGDIPLLPSQFHMALVDYVMMHAGDAADKGKQIDRAEQRWERKINEALEFGCARTQGDPELRVLDTWTGFSEYKDPPFGL